MSKVTPEVLRKTADAFENGTLWWGTGAYRSNNQYCMIGGIVTTMGFQLTDLMESSPDGEVEIINQVENQLNVFFENDGYEFGSSFNDDQVDKEPVISKLREIATLMEANNAPASR